MSLIAIVVCSNEKLERKGYQMADSGRVKSLETIFSKHWEETFR